MAKKTAATKSTSTSTSTNPFEIQPAMPADQAVNLVHVFRASQNGKTKFVCDTDSLGRPTPEGRSMTEIVLNASEGFIPLWTKDTTLRWRFQERSMRFFRNQEAAKNEIRNLLAEAIIAWGDAVPIKFSEHQDAWDFEIVMRNADDCDGTGCVLASAFFPDAGRHELNLYPILFRQTREEQIATLTHEIGHVFGLRHFFANISETQWASQIFGHHNPFTIMNYGAESVLTDDDRADLKNLYQMVWNGELSYINGTPIRLVKPFHTSGTSPEGVASVGQIQTVVQPQSAALQASA